MRRIAMLSALLSLLTGCGRKPAPPQPLPDKPGVSIALSYPVLLVGERDLKVKNDAASLITTSVANGGEYYVAYRFIDSAGNEYAPQKATAFGRKSAWLDMGRTPYEVFLELKLKGRISLAKAKADALAAAIEAGPAVIGPDGKEIATANIGATNSFPELMEACRDPFRRK
jgi:hypothetical protein